MDDVKTELNECCVNTLKNSEYRVDEIFYETQYHLENPKELRCGNGCGVIYFELVGYNTIFKRNDSVEERINKTLAIVDMNFVKNFKSQHP